MVGSEQRVPNSPWHIIVPGIVVVAELAYVVYPPDQCQATQIPIQFAIIVVPAKQATKLPHPSNSSELLTDACVAGGAALRLPPWLQDLAVISVPDGLDLAEPPLDQ